MKNIDHNYWIGEYVGRDADYCNPDLRITMQELYGEKGFDFGRGFGVFYGSDRKTHCNPDGYTTYTSLTKNYITRMPFRANAVKNNYELSKRCYFLAGTIAGEIFFPAHQSNGRTLNPARGFHREINDMFYHTLESIRKYYENECGDYPIKNDIERYGYFFDSFGSFDGYLEYNLLQDHEFLPKKFPTNEGELVDFWTGSVDFLEARARRIEEYAIDNGLLDH